MAQRPQHLPPHRLGNGVIPRHPQRYLRAGGVVFALEFEAVGGLQQPLAVIQHLLADLGQSALVGASFKKFDAKLNL